MNKALEQLKSDYCEYIFYLKEKELIQAKANTDEVIEVPIEQKFVHFMLKKLCNENSMDLTDFDTLLTYLNQLKSAKLATLREPIVESDEPTNTIKSLFDAEIPRPTSLLHANFSYQETEMPSLMNQVPSLLSVNFLPAPQKLMSDNVILDLNSFSNQPPSLMSLIEPVAPSLMSVQTSHNNNHNNNYKRY